MMPTQSTDPRPRRRRDPESSRRALPRLLALLVPVLVAVLFPLPASADGWIQLRRPHPLPPGIRPHYLPGGMEVVRHHVSATIRDESATVEVDETFRNPHPRELEGTYYFPVPAGAAVDDFRATLGGKELAGEILTREEAKSVYEQLVRKAKDPALLEYYGRELFRARVFPIPARGDIDVKIRYRHTIQQVAGLSRFEYPLDTGRFSGGPYKDVSITIDVQTTSPLRSVTSRSHSLKTERVGPQQIHAHYKAATDPAQKDLVVEILTAQDGLAGGVRCYRDSHEDGYFLLRLSPAAEIPQDLPANTLIFVVDTSGSMAGEKILHAKSTLRNALGRLRPSDSFQIITFAARVRSFRDQPALATPEALAEARQFVDSLTARGGTDLDSGVRAGIAAAQASDDAVLLLLSDGAPTVGVVDPKLIVEGATKQNKGDTRLHILGVGHDVNTLLLDDISRKNRGSQSYVEQGAEIEVVVSAALDKVLYPCVTDLSVTGDGIELRELEPAGPYDLFFGEDLVVTGRYSGSGPARVLCRGEEAGDERTFVFAAEFVTRGGDSDVPYLWAQSRIMRLLDEMRSAAPGASGNLRDEIVALGLRYGIVTPYTSFLVREDAASPLASAVRRRVAESPKLRAEAGDEASGFAKDTGSSSFGYSQRQAARKKALIVGRVSEAKREAEWRQALEIQRIAGRAFYPIENQLVDGRLQGDTLPTPSMRLRIGSEASLEFLRKNPAAAPFLGSGQPLLFQWGKQVIALQVDDSAPEIVPIYEEPDTPPVETDSKLDPTTKPAPGAKPTPKPGDKPAPKAGEKPTTQPKTDKGEATKPATKREKFSP